MTLYDFFLKFRERWVRLHTKMVTRKLGSCGGGSRIEPPFQILNPHRLSLGREVTIASGGWIICLEEHDGRQYDGRVVVGDRVQIREGTQFSAAGRITLGDHVGIGRNCLICDHFHGYKDLATPILLNPLTEPKPVDIGEGTMVGGCSMIGPGVRIGRHAMIGYGSVVVHDIPDFCVAAGAPARVISRYDFTSRTWAPVRDGGK